MKRIHKLAKQIGVDKKVLIKLLQSRGHGVRSASSQIADIYADALVSEFESISDVEAEMIQLTQASEAISKKKAEPPRHNDAPAYDHSGTQGINANDKPKIRSDESSLNPFNSIPARDWLAEALWRNQYPEFENNIILIGDGPFETTELRSFLGRWEISSDLIGEQPEDDGSDSGYWGYSSTAVQPVFVFGTDKGKAYELESLLSDKTCREKPHSDGSPLLAYWLEQYLVDNGKSVFFRSRNLGKLKLISQEMLLAYLFSEYAIANELGPIWTDHIGSHPLLGNIDEIKLRANHSPTFSWPSTAAKIGDGSVDGDEWPDIGLLKYMGYTVGVSGESISKRREILASTYELTKLPRIGSPEYVRQWGHSQSAARLKKMADAIAAFVRNQKRKSSPSHEAISDWEIDLDWLKKNYYTGRYDYKFNWPNTRG